MSDPKTVGEVARRALALGLSVLPPQEDGTKAPFTEVVGYDEDGKPIRSWKRWQEVTASTEDMDAWYGPRTGVGYVCGAVSGGLEVLDFDDHPTYLAFRERAIEVGEEDLVERIEAGCLDKSPSGGTHCSYYTDEVRGSTKLAQRPTPTEANPHARKTLIETKGEGGYIIAPPSNGRVHPSGGRYESIRGGVETIVTLTADERERLWDLARSFDEIPRQEIVEPRSRKPPADGEVRPGDDFNSRQSWADILEGWVAVYSRGEKIYWRRPDKAAGISATTNHMDSGLLFVFTSSTAFDPEKSYSKFGAYAVLHHGRDFKAATKALSAKGYGSFPAWVWSEESGWQEQTCKNPCPKGRGTTIRLRKPGEDKPRPLRSLRPRQVEPAEEGGETTPTLEARVQAKVDVDGPAGLLRDRDLIRELSELEENDPGEYGAILIDLRTDKSFPTRDFRRAIQQAKGGIAKLPVPYLEKDGCTFAGDVRLCNFTSRIIEEVVRDNGSEDMRIDFRIAMERPNGEEMTTEVRADEYSGMAWITAKFGAKAIVEPGRESKDHLRAAIQHLSGEIPRRTIYTHTGWRMIDGEWLYLHAAGAIGARGANPDISVEMKGSLSKFSLPSPPKGTERARAIQASLGMLNLYSPSRQHSGALAAALVSSPYRAVICKATTSIAFTGDSDAQKSSTAALAQQHFGPEMDKDGLPFNWSSTANSLEMDLYYAKDTLAVVDEFVMPGGSSEGGAQQSKADRLIRAAANNHGRTRLTKEGDRKAAMPPRAMMLSTGEDSFERQSAVARTLPVQFSKKRANRPATVNLDVLTRCQLDADSGLYASSMAAFIQWLAPRLDAVVKRLHDKAKKYRSEAYRPGDHGRSSEAVGDLYAGFEIFMEFAVEAGAISKEDADRDRALVWDGLMEASAEVRSDIAEEGSPSEKFLRLLASAMSSNHAHLVDKHTGEAPIGREGACGWKRRKMYQGSTYGLDYDWDQSQNKIGWIDDEYIYLIRNVAYDTASKQIGAGEAQLPKLAQLSKQLDSEGKLARLDSRNKTQGVRRLTCRETIMGSKLTVLVIKIEDILGSTDPAEQPSTATDDLVIGETA